MAQRNRIISKEQEIYIKRGSMMTFEDQAQLHLLTVIEAVVKTLQERIEPKTYRANNLERIMTLVDRIDETYGGYLPDDFIEEGQKFHSKVIKHITDHVHKYNRVINDGVTVARDARTGRFMKLEAHNAPE